MSEHSSRIDELQKEGTALLEKRVQAANAIASIDNRVAEIRGAISELQKLDKPVEKELVKEEKK